MFAALKKYTSCILAMGNSKSKQNAPKPKPKSAKQQRAAAEGSIARSQKSGVLALATMKLKAIPPAVFDCTNIRLLNLSTNNLTEIDGAVAKLTNLQRLLLAHNKVFFVMTFACCVVKSLSS